MELTLLVLVVIFVVLVVIFVAKEEEVDPAEFEKKKDLFNIYENELHPKNIEENEGIKDYTQFDGINDDWEEFNERDFSSKKGA